MTGGGYGMVGSVMKGFLSCWRRNLRFLGGVESLCRWGLRCWYHHVLRLEGFCFGLLVLGFEWFRWSGRCLNSKFFSFILRGWVQEVEWSLF